MRVDFDSFENGNASLSINRATPGEYFIRLDNVGMHCIAYANDAELRLLRAKLNDLLDWR